MTLDRRWKEEYKKDMKKLSFSMFKKELEDTTNEERYVLSVKAAMPSVAKKWVDTERDYDHLHMKKVRYFSLEYLPGRLYGNTLVNLNLKEDAQEALEELHLDFNHLEDQEHDITIGNGGLGRLAAGTLDGAATMEYPVYGYGIKYHNGFYKQKIENGRQTEHPDPWEKKNCKYPLSIDVKAEYYTVAYGRENTPEYQKVEAFPFEIPIAGHMNDVVNTLTLWDTKDDFGIVDKLYPSDKTEAGKMLRLKQEYFFVSASVQQIVKEYVDRFGPKFGYFPKYNCFQMNDTHSAMVIPELMRILMDEYGWAWHDAWHIVTRTCSYTNHTVMKEALETWDIELFKKLLPRVYEIVHEIHLRFKGEISSRYPFQREKIESMAILYDGKVRMANLAIVGSFSVNGVSKVHSEILKNKIFKDFHEMMPEGTFKNVTNGVSFRRYLFSANKELGDLIRFRCKNYSYERAVDHISEFSRFAEDEEVVNCFKEIRQKKKAVFAEYIYEQTGVEVDPKAIFSAQVKRIHTYKRQDMNAKRILWLYMMLKDHPEKIDEFYPMVFVFAGKAHPDFYEAKETIHFIYKVAEMVNNDTAIKNKLKVVFLEDYGVTLSEMIVSSCDISEQISLAGTEASGTGNMKFMMNGALTLGTLDGANIEICEEVGEENMFLFGLITEEVEKYKAETDCSKDPFFVNADLPSYVEATLKANACYRDEPEKWWRMAILNVAGSGVFSIDRTVDEYARNIWGVERKCLVD